MKILVHLVSGQNAPNFIAAQQLAPGVNIFLYTEGSSRQAEWLASAIGGSVERSLVDPYSYESTAAACRHILEQHAGDELMLNFTAGTKIMSVAAFNTFFEVGLSCIYVDSEHLRIIDFKKGSPQAVTGQKVHIAVDKFLALSGHSVRPQPEPDIDGKAAQNAGRFLKQNYQICAKLLTQSAKEVHQRTKSKLPLEFRKQEGKSYLESGQNASTLHVEVKNKVLCHETLSGRDAIRFLTGGWLEETTGDVFERSGKFSGYARNLLAEWQNPSARMNDKFPKNEVDGLAILNGSPFIIECKSGGIFVEQIYKLKALKELFGGTYARAVLVTYFSDQSFSVMEKAADFGIEIVRLGKLRTFVDGLEKKIPNLNL